MSAPTSSIEITGLDPNATPNPLDLLITGDADDATPFLLKKTTLLQAAVVILAQPWDDDGNANGHALAGLTGLFSDSLTATITGFIRMANGELVNWQNNNGDGTVGLTVNTSDELILSGANAIRLDTGTDLRWGTGSEQRILSDDLGFFFQTQVGDTFLFNIQNTDEYEFTAAALDVKTNKIINLANNPTLGNDAANKNYVDAITGANIGSGDGFVFKDRTYPTLNFRTLLAGTNITIQTNSEDITINAADEVINSSAATLEITGTQTITGPVDFDFVLGSPIGTGIIDEVATGVFRLTGNIFQLFSSLAVSGAGDSMTGQWQSSVDEAFTVPVPVGKASISDNTLADPNAPVAVAFVDASSG